ncbi:MAG: hypothetical protein GXO33_00470 [Epsilonproteobacteria bacterium]|nr:hypothetical protein [Campylobacterota bacterium]
MSRRQILLFFVGGCLSFSLWGATAWDHEERFRLRKDQWQTVEIGALGKRHVLAFRWTLYDRAGLVMHVLYDGRPFQPVLFLKRGRDAFRLKLFARPDSEMPLPLPSPYALLVFQSFNAKERRAVIDLKVKTGGRSEINYVKGK